MARWAAVIGATAGVLASLAAPARPSPDGNGADQQRHVVVLRHEPQRAPTPVGPRLMSESIDIRGAKRTVQRRIARKTRDARELAQRVFARQHQSGDIDALERARSRLADWQRESLKLGNPELSEAVRRTRSLALYALAVNRPNEYCLRVGTELEVHLNHELLSLLDVASDDDPVGYEAPAGGSNRIGDLLRAAERRVARYRPPTWLVRSPHHSAVETLFDLAKWAEDQPRTRGWGQKVLHVVQAVRTRSLGRAARERLRESAYNDGNVSDDVESLAQLEVLRRAAVLSQTLTERYGLDRYDLTWDELASLHVGGVPAQFVLMRAAQAVSDGAVIFPQRPRQVVLSHRVRIGQKTFGPGVVSLPPIFRPRLDELNPGTDSNGRAMDTDLRVAEAHTLDNRRLSDHVNEVMDTAAALRLAPGRLHVHVAAPLPDPDNALLDDRRSELAAMDRLRRECHFLSLVMLGRHGYWPPAQRVGWSAVQPLPAADRLAKVAYQLDHRRLKPAERARHAGLPVTPRGFEYFCDTHQAQDTQEGAVMRGNEIRYLPTIFAGFRERNRALRGLRSAFLDAIQWRTLTGEVGLAHADIRDWIDGDAAAPSLRVAEYANKQSRRTAYTGWLRNYCPLGSDFQLYTPATIQLTSPDADVYVDEPLADQLIDYAETDRSKSYSAPIASAMAASVDPDWFVNENRAWFPTSFHRQLNERANRNPGISALMVDWGTDSAWHAIKADDRPSAKAKVEQAQLAAFLSLPPDDPQRERQILRTFVRDSELLRIFGASLLLQHVAEDAVDYDGALADCANSPSSVAIRAYERRTLQAK